jgi:hypothetical protein
MRPYCTKCGIDPDAQHDLEQRCDQLEKILRAILAADARGQGLPFAEAMRAANEAIYGRPDPSLGRNR